MASLNYLTTWIPNNRIKLTNNNFGKDENFIFNKTGFISKAICNEIPSEKKTLQFGLNACNKLLQSSNFDLNKIDVILFVNQSFRSKVPHLASLIHKHLEIKNKNIFTCDIGLGCTGYVQTLQIAKNMLNSNEFQNVLIITSDQYSAYLKDNDHNTQLIFGEGSSASIVSNNELGYKVCKYKNHVDSNYADAIKFDEKDFINMNGRKVFEYVMTASLKEINSMIQENNLNFEDPSHSVFVPHQGSKFIVEMLSKKLGLKNKNLFCSSNVGNLVSSSIPYALEKLVGSQFINKEGLPHNILLSGFGVGLATSSILLKK